MAIELVMTFGILSGAWLASVDQDSPVIDRDQVAWFKGLTSRQRTQLREHLAAYRKLPSEERKRIQENARRFRDLPETERTALRDRFQKQAPDERRRGADLGRLMFRHRTTMAGFPRGMFIEWMKREHPGLLERVSGMPEDDRQEKLRRLSAEFTGGKLRQVERMMRAHRCPFLKRLRDLRESGSPDVWARLKPVLDECRSSHARRPGTGERPSDRR